MKTAMKLPLVLAGAAVLGLSACAYDGVDVPDTAQGRAVHFNQLDKDDDDRLHARELETHLILYRDFALYDTDNNGWIGRGEFERYLEAMEHPVVRYDD